VKAHRRRDRLVHRRVKARAAAAVATDNAAEAESLYSKLEGVILPMYYHERSRFLGVMQHAIAINGSFFNTQRMVQQYITDAYCTDAPLRIARVIRRDGERRDFSSAQAILVHRHSDRGVHAYFVQRSDLATRLDTARGDDAVPRGPA